MLYTKDGAKAEVDKDQRAIMEKAGWVKSSAAIEEVVVETEDDKVLKSDLQAIIDAAVEKRLAEIAKTSETVAVEEPAKTEETTAFVELSDAEFQALPKEKKREYTLAKIEFDKTKATN